MFLYKLKVINYNMVNGYILVNSIQGSFQQGNVEKFGIARVLLKALHMYDPF